MHVKAKRTMRGACVAAIAAAWISGCTIPRAVSPPKAKRLSSFAPMPPLSGSVRVVASGQGRLAVEGSAFKGHSDLSSYYADVQAWSEHFAQTLRAQFQKRGVNTTGGPAVAVTLLHIAAHDRAFYRVHCRLSLRVRPTAGQAAGQTFSSEQTVSMKAKRRCIADAYKAIVAQIMRDATITKLVQSAR
jgi:hypothetical protein